MGKTTKIMIVYFAIAMFNLTTKAQSRLVIMIDDTAGFVVQHNPDGTEYINGIDKHARRGYVTDSAKDNWIWEHKMNVYDLDDRMTQLEKEIHRLGVLLQFNTDMSNLYIRKVDSLENRIMALQLFPLDSIIDRGRYPIYISPGGDMRLYGLSTGGGIIDKMEDMPNVPVPPPAYKVYRPLVLSDSVFVNGHLACDTTATKTLWIRESRKRRKK